MREAHLDEPHGGLRGAAVSSGKESRCDSVTGRIEHRRPAHGEWRASVSGHDDVGRAYTRGDGQACEPGILERDALRARQCDREMRTVG